MAVTESPETQPGSGEPPASRPRRSRIRARWRRWTLAGLALLVTATLVVLAALAATYQPVQFGGESGGRPPVGLPAGTGLSVVNTFGSQTGQLYVPPQLGAFTIVESIENTGPEAVTIEAVTVLSPQEQAIFRDGLPPWPLTPAGQALGWIENWHSEPAARPIAGLSLGPGQIMWFGIPVRLSGTCYNQGWVVDNDFYVEVRFLFSTHWVAIPFALPLLAHQPSYPGQEPAQDLTCLSK